MSGSFWNSERTNTCTVSCFVDFLKGRDIYGYLCSYVLTLILSHQPLVFLDLKPSFAFNVILYLTLSDGKFSTRKDRQNELEDVKKECTDTICHAKANYRHFVGLYETVPAWIAIPVIVILTLKLIFIVIPLAIFGFYTICIMFSLMGSPCPVPLIIFVSCITSIPMGTPCPLPYLLGYGVIQ